MFTECLQSERRIIFCNVTHKVCRDLNNKINDSLILEVSIVSFHARISLLSEVLLTNLAIVHCGWLSQITCSACWLAVVASTINALSKASRNCRWINQTRLIAYEVCFTLASSTQQYLSFIYFCAVFSVQRILNVQKSLGGHTQKFCNFAVIEGNQMPLGIFMRIWTNNKHVKFHVKIPSGCLENGKQL